MKVEQFQIELCKRFLWKLNDFETDLVISATNKINAMTGGAFFRSIQNLKDTYVFPSGEGNT